MLDFSLCFVGVGLNVFLPMMRIRILIRRMRWFLLSRLRILMMFFRRRFGRFVRNTIMRVLRMCLHLPVLRLRFIRLFCLSDGRG